MIAALLAIGIFLLLAWLLVRWAESDYRHEGRLTTRSSVGAYLLYLFHADSVATAALAGALRINAIPEPLGWGLGAIIGGAGLVLFVASGARLALAGQDQGEHLVVTGPYKLLRHPQNLGWAMVLLGIALAGRSVLALLLVAMFAVFVERYMRVEEEHLARRFGAVWEQYRDRTPAFLGRRRPSRTSA